MFFYFILLLYMIRIPRKFDQAKLFYLWWVKCLSFINSKQAKLSDWFGVGVYTRRIYLLCVRTIAIMYYYGGFDFLFFYVISYVQSIGEEAGDLLARPEGESQSLYKSKAMFHGYATLSGTLLLDPWWVKKEQFFF